MADEIPVPPPLEKRSRRFSQQTRNSFVPLLMAAGVIVGILLGSFFSSHFSRQSLSIISGSSNKINDLFHLIDDQYVDSVDIPDLVERSVPQILKQLDPHSTYFTAQKAGESMQELEGHFSGIGVQFAIVKDTVRIARIIKGGPSESVGLQAGDAIVSVDGKNFTGPQITNDTVLSSLKGPRESEVLLEVKRKGSDRLLSFHIRRNDVPVPSIGSAYMMEGGTGYIKINSFGTTTHSEFLASLASLQAEGLKGLIIDLRGNLGGLMDPAAKIVNEFLPAGRLIVYTEGRHSPRREYLSDGRGVYQQLPLVVLIDEISASASEILAGAIQDNDRGTIVGRRSFGKGLVQMPIEFDDGSLLRLTIARYYTPSGRCVQKPYTPGDEEDYGADLLLRAEHGEYQNADSIKTQGEAFKTLLGRDVYGGGGIIPDEFVAEDTTGRTSYYMEAYMRNLFYQYAYFFTDRHRSELSRLTKPEDAWHYIGRRDIVEDFATYAEGEGLKRRNLLIRESAHLLRQTLTAQILMMLFDTQEATRFQNIGDPCIAKAENLIAEGLTRPEAPAPETSKAAAALPFRSAGYLCMTLRPVATPWMMQHYPTLFAPLAVCPQRKRFSANA